MSFCLTKITSFSPSLCYSVFKKHLSLFVIMSFCLQKKHLSLFLIMSLCLQKKHLSLFLIMSLCRPSEDTELRKDSTEKQKRGCVYYDTPSFVMLLPRRGNQFSASFSSTFSVFGFWCKTKIMARAMAAVIIPPATQSCPHIASNADMAIRIMTIE